MTTELEAINGMLSAIGEAPVATVDLSLTEVHMAHNLLTAATGEILAMGWRFNTEWGMVLTPSSQEGELNVFTPPANLLDFSTTRTAGQYNLDITLRDGVFYDRVKNRGAFEEDELIIDAILFFPFPVLPLSAQRAIEVLATRRYIAHVVGSATLEGFTAQDEFLAIRNLKRKEGLPDDRLNIFHNPSVRRMLGRPFHTPLGTIDTRPR